MTFNKKRIEQAIDNMRQYGAADKFVKTVCDRLYKLEVEDTPEFKESVRVELKKLNGHEFDLELEDQEEFEAALDELMHFLKIKTRMGEISTGEGQVTEETAFIGSRSKRAQRRMEKEIIQNRRKKIADRKAGQKGRIASMKDVVGARNAALVQFIAGCLDLKLAGSDAQSGTYRFTRTHRIFDNSAEVTAKIRSRGEDIQFDFKIEYFNDDEQTHNHESGAGKAKSVSELIDSYRSFIKESQPSDDEGESGKFASYIIKRLDKVNKGDVLDKVTTGLKLPPEKISKIQRYIVSRTKGGHKEQEEATMKPINKSLLMEASSKDKKVVKLFDNLVDAGGGISNSMEAIAKKAKKAYDGSTKSLVKAIHIIDKTKVKDYDEIIENVSPIYLSEWEAAVKAIKKCAEYPKNGETSNMKPINKSLLMKVCAATGMSKSDIEEIAKKMSAEGMAYRCLAALFGRGNFRYEKADIKSSKGGWAIAFKKGETDMLLEWKATGGFTLTKDGKVIGTGAKIAEVKASMGRKASTKSPAKKAAAKAPAKKATTKKSTTKKPAKKKASGKKS